jgi:hypothetical protein
MNGKSLGYVAIDAITHMIGQTQEVFGRGATIAEIAAWLNVSKPTAKRFIENELKDIACKETHDWRKGHSVQYRYVLNQHRYSGYERGLFYSSYKVYANAIIKGYIG